MSSRPREDETTIFSFGVTVAQMILVHLVGVRIPEGKHWSHSLMEKHFATDEKTWGSSPYGTSIGDIAQR